MILLSILIMVTVLTLSFGFVLISTLGTLGLIVGGDLFVACFIIWYLVFKRYRKNK